MALRWAVFAFKMGACFQGLCVTLRHFETIELSLLFDTVVRNITNLSNGPAFC